MVPAFMCIQRLGSRLPSRLGERPGDTVSHVDVSLVDVDHCGVGCFIGPLR